MSRLKTIWVGRSKKQAEALERKYAKKYGDAIASSGPIIKNKKVVPGYAVSVPSYLIKRKRR